MSLLLFAGVEYYPSWVCEGSKILLLIYSFQKYLMVASWVEFFYEQVPLTLQRILIQIKFNLKWI